MEASQSPVFIVGCSRSGSTLLSRILDTHSSFAILPETWAFVLLDQLGCLEAFQNSWQYVVFMNDLWRNLSQYPDIASLVVAEEGRKRPQYLGPTNVVLDSLGRAYAEARGVRFWGEKTPGHLLWLPQIRSAFPGAKIVVTMRDPRDILVSYDDRWGCGRRETSYLMKAAAQVRFYLRFLADLSLPGTHWVRYEALASDPEGTAQELCRFLGVEFEGGMLEFHRSQRKVMQDMPGGQHHQLLSRPVTSDRVGRYKEAFDAEQLRLIEWFLAAELEAFGYAPCVAEDIRLTEETKFWGQCGLRRYELMRSGAIRRKLRRRARLRLRATNFLRYMGPSFSARFASSAEAWEKRIAIVATEESRQAVA